MDQSGLSPRIPEGARHRTLWEAGLAGAVLGAVAGAAIGASRGDAIGAGIGAAVGAVIPLRRLLYLFDFDPHLPDTRPTVACATPSPRSSG